MLFFSSPASFRAMNHRQIFVSFYNFRLRLRHTKKSIFSALVQEKCFRMPQCRKILHKAVQALFHTDYEKCNYSARKDAGNEKNFQNHCQTNRDKVWPNWRSFLMRREMFTQVLVATLHCTGVTCNYYIIPYLVHTRMYV